MKSKRWANALASESLGKQNIQAKEVYCERLSTHPSPLPLSQLKISDSTEERLSAISQRWCFLSCVSQPDVSPFNF